MHLQQFIAVRGDRADVPNVAILVTDGESTILADETIPAAARARNSGIAIFT